MTPVKGIIFNLYKKYIFELGAGNGASKDILENKKIILTDLQKYPWIDRKVDMTTLNLGKKYKKKVDIFIVNHALHHCSNPARLLKRMSKYLKKNGLILINDPEISIFFKFFLFLLKHEGWSFKVNIFNTRKAMFKSTNPWNANNAIAYLLFNHEDKFHFHFPEYKIIKNELNDIKKEFSTPRKTEILDIEEEQEEDVHYIQKG